MNKRAKLTKRMIPEGFKTMDAGYLANFPSSRHGDLIRVMKIPTSVWIEQVARISHEGDTSQASLPENLQYEENGMMSVYLLLGTDSYVSGESL